MELATYLAEERGRCARIARNLNIAGAYLSQMASGLRPVPPDLVPALEAECEHKVPRWLLRPKDWHRIWPEAVNEPEAPPVPDPEQASA